MPPLVIQPFIENSIKHGIMPLENEKGKVIIELYETFEFLWISITDNGVGFKKELNFKDGDGLRISLERLKIQNIKNDIILDNALKGTHVLIKIKL